jgi:hypothetical protein
MIYPEHHSSLRFVNDMFVLWTCSGSVRELRYPRECATEIRKFNIDNSKRFLALPILMTYPKKCEPGRSGSGHLAIILYDKQAKRIEYFDPIYTTDTIDNYESRKVLAPLYKKLTCHFDLDIKEYLDPIHLCFRGPDGITKGVQLVQEEEVQIKLVGMNSGFCAMYSLWYIEIRLKYPDVHPAKLIKDIVKRNSPLTNMIYTYTQQAEIIRIQLEQELKKTVDIDLLARIHNKDTFHSVPTDVRSKVLAEFFQCLKRLAMGKRYIVAPPASPNLDIQSLSQYQIANILSSQSRHDQDLSSLSSDY